MNVVQREMSRSSATVRCFNAARSIVCGATCKIRGGNSSPLRFNAARSIVCGATQLIGVSAPQLVVSMPHAALYVVQRYKHVIGIRRAEFQCRTQHCMWCNSDFLYRFSLMGRHFHRKTTASIGAFPCAARSCAQMENGDGRMRLCGIAVAFSTFLHLLYHIKYDMTFQHYSHSFFTSLGFGRTARLRKRLSFPSMLICAMFLSHSGCWVRPQSSIQMRSLIASL